MRGQFHVTRSPDGWREWDQTNVDVTDRGVVLASRLASTPVTSDIFAVDVAIDDCRDLNVLDAAGHVYRHDRQTETTSSRIEPDGITEPQAICISSDTIYVVDGNDGRVRAYSTELRQLRWVSDVAFDTPVAVAVDTHGVAVLTRGSIRGEGALDRLDSGGNVTSIATGLTCPKDLTVDRVGTRYILDEIGDSDTANERTVVREIPADASRTGAGRDESTTCVDHRLPEPIQGVTCLAAVQAGELVVAIDGGESDKTVFCRWVVGEDAPESIERIDRGCSTLAAPRGTDSRVVGGVYAIDDTPTHPVVYRLDSGRQTKRNDRTGQYDAQLIARFDSGVRNTEWHSVQLDIDHRGGDTQIRLHYCATDDEMVADSRDLEQLDQVGPKYASRLLEEDIPSVAAVAALTPDEIAARTDVSEKVTNDWVTHARSLRADWKRKVIDWRPLNEPNPTDALLNEATGRYLWVKLELIGTEHTSPRVATFRTSYPRETQTPLQHLPAVYRESETADPFLEQFLALFSSVFTDVESGIDDVTQYLDPAAIPEEHLAWLGDWMALDVDETWPESARRELLERAPDLAKQRGTRQGLLAVLRIYLRHTRDASTWRDALARDSESIIEVVTDGRGTALEVARKLVEHETLRPLSGDAGLTQMLSTWTRVVAHEDDLLDELVGADILDDEDEREARQATKELLAESDEGSLWYVAQYASVLRELSEAAANGNVSWDDVSAHRKQYAQYIRTTAHRQGPSLIEGPDLDCIDNEATRKPFVDLIGHDRSVVVLTRASVGSERLGTARRIVQSQLPAHAEGTVVSLRPQIRLGGHSHLGVNTELSKPRFVLGQSGLGNESVLDSREPFAQLGVRSVLDEDSFIS